ncbi:hypothetical protein [Lapidilactobacillus wuchangensis]|uniref:hypothetical protein n=1 Tax=Lapidilactobacillus wuchangensis TaxID=2486001 RepID=UPI0013DDBF5B|nr:hypothetical protein [Lapidilactobacillus wuchangensis]
MSAATLFLVAVPLRTRLVFEIVALAISSNQCRPRFTTSKPGMESDAILPYIHSWVLFFVVLKRVRAGKGLGIT